MLPLDVDSIYKWHKKPVIAIGKKTGIQMRLNSLLNVIKRFVKCVLMAKVSVTVF